MQVLIEINKEEVKKSINDVRALLGVLERIRKPAWYFVVERLYVGESRHQDILKKAWQRALKVLQKTLKKENWENYPDHDFPHTFTRWVRNVVDDTVTVLLIRALKKNRDWAWEVLKERYVIPRVERTVPYEKQEEVVAEALVRLVKAIRRWKKQSPQNFSKIFLFSFNVFYG